jgi:hypothetical protein
MIKDAMVRLDGIAADEAHLSAAEYISGAFDGQIIRIFLNILPLIMPTEGDTVAAATQRAREAGDRREAALIQRLSQLKKPVDIRRFDVFSDTICDIAAREARCADALRRWVPTTHRRNRKI